MKTKPNLISINERIGSSGIRASLINILPLVWISRTALASEVSERGCCVPESVCWAAEGT